MNTVGEEPINIENVLLWRVVHRLREASLSLSLTLSPSLNDKKSERTAMN